MVASEDKYHKLFKEVCDRHGFTVIELNEETEFVVDVWCPKGWLWDVGKGSVLTSRTKFGGDVEIGYKALYEIIRKEDACIVDKEWAGGAEDE